MDVRTCEINLNHWYVVAQSIEVTNKPIEVRLWYHSIVLYRDSKGKIHGLDNRCPHRQVKLSEGKVVENSLECAYHGWQFDSKGVCTFIPYLLDNQVLPNCKISAYPVKECYGFIWIYLGSQQILGLQKIEPIRIPEWEQLNYINTISVIDCQAHFSFLIENLMDMYHGHLHNDYQAWTEAKLKTLTTDEEKVKVIYEAKSYYKIDKIWSISQLFFTQFRSLHPEPLIVTYYYPHWRSTLGEDFTLYCLFCPISLTHTKAYLVHFTSLNTFRRLHKLPRWFRQFIKDKLSGTAQSMLDGLVKQDIIMIEQEQQAYTQQVLKPTYEINPTISAVQRMIKKQVEQQE
ncbi:aromatic ring-hydroxylating dioxygenase subunit alpha [Crocosphaera chwakensis]|uniref:Rieske (2Fe-2S) region n=1 Tax=Crocosphaera chwakensis CCY0110 TaxID=391612 RepID=A3IRD7_9CHRO|nr:aromatic ring-hydroxylating dioxygenase subunit alpha [Crocosphaera chwakensis]EAZ90939.1 Rieske (2Fe-2S) region [Crocosphaera chwakensis CCY0110]